MWKIIAIDECIWVHFKAQIQEEYLYRNELEQKSGVSGYGSANIIKYCEMEYEFINFASLMAERDAALYELATKNGNLETQLG